MFFDLVSKYYTYFLIFISQTLSPFSPKACCTSLYFSNPPIFFWMRICSNSQLSQCCKAPGLSILQRFRDMLYLLWNQKGNNMRKSISNQELGLYSVAKGSIRTSPKQKGNMRGDTDIANATHFLLCHMYITFYGFNFWLQYI